MYGALWRIIPGPAWFRVFILLVLLAGVLAACFLWFFPDVVAPRMPFNDGTMTDQ